MTSGKTLLAVLVGVHLACGCGVVPVVRADRQCPAGSRALSAATTEPDASCPALSRASAEPDTGCPARPPCLGAEPGLLLAGAAEGKMFEEVDTEGKEDAAVTPRGSRFAVRAGAFVVASAGDVTFDPSFSLGASYDVVARKALGIELSAEYSDVSDTSGGRNSALVLLSAGARFAPGGGKFYLVGSGSMVMETYADDLTDYGASNVAPLLGVGAGLRPGKGKWDARVGYSMPLAGGGPGILAVFGGYAF